MMTPLSAVHRGVAFELRSLRLLQSHFSMALRRVGGKSDGGVDLVGWWWLPFASNSNPPAALSGPDGLLRRRLRVVAQCKAEKKKIGPKYVREMEGVWHLQSRSPLPHESLLLPDVHPTVALLLSESPFSKSTVLHAFQSAVPFLLIHFPDCSEDDSETCTVCPNPTLTRLVKPLAFCWERNFTPGLSMESNLSTGGRPGLWWHGRRLGSWAPEFPDLDQDTT